MERPSLAASQPVRHAKQEDQPCNVAIAPTLLFLNVTVTSTLNAANAIVMCSISMTLAACPQQHPEATLPPKTALKVPTDSI